MTNVEALKEVYVALGGNAEDFTATTNDEAIALIATVAGGGSGGAESWTPDFEITFTKGTYDETKDLIRISGASKTLDEIKELLGTDVSEYRSKRVRVTIDYDSHESVHNCTIVSYALGAQGKLKSVALMDDILGTPVVADIPSYSLLSAGDIPMVLFPSGDTNGPVIIQYGADASDYIKYVTVTVGSTTVEIE
jgi:hypothetical protein